MENNIFIQIDRGEGFNKYPMRVDLVLLKKQRNTLLSLRKRKNIKSDTKSSLDGLIHLCDALIG